MCIQWAYLIRIFSAFGFLMKRRICFRQGLPVAFFLIVCYLYFLANHQQSMEASIARCIASEKFITTRTIIEIEYL